MARIAVAGFHHETNCFLPDTTDYDYFASHRDRPPLVRDGDVIEWLSGASFALGGFLAEMRSHEIVPLLWTSGGAGGLVTAAAFERIAAEIVGRLSERLPVDAVYLDLHGAMCTEAFEDGEGELLRRVRAVVGERVPVVVSLDYHANVTPAMVRLTDGMAAYRTYPHVDRPETGARAAGILTALLERGRPRGRALRKLPFLLPLNGQCTLVEPSRGIVEATAVTDGDVIDLCYLAGFPAADLHDCGPAVVAHAWSQAAAETAAEGLAREIEAREAEFEEEMVSPAEGVRRAIEIASRAGRPVILADTQDNPGCGGTADTTGLLAELVRADAQGAVLGCFCDAEAARRAHAAGAGAEIGIALGGRNGPEGVAPFRGTFTVGRLGDGRMRTTGPVSGGRDVDLGPMALLTLGGVSVVVTSKRMQALDKAPFRHLGVDPARQRILALKSTCHFRAAFAPLAEAVIVVFAPGRYLADPAGYPYQRLRPGVRLRPNGPAFGGSGSRRPPPGDAGSGF